MLTDGNAIGAVPMPFNLPPTDHPLKPIPPPQWQTVLIFGILQMFLSQCPNLESVWVVSAVGAACSLGYSVIALALGASSLRGGGSLWGREAPPFEKVRRGAQAPVLAVAGVWRQERSWRTGVDGEWASQSAREHLRTRPQSTPRCPFLHAALQAMGVFGALGDVSVSFFCAMIILEVQVRRVACVVLDWACATAVFSHPCMPLGARELVRPGAASEWPVRAPPAGHTASGRARRARGRHAEVCEHRAKPGTEPLHHGAPRIGTKGWKGVHLQPPSLQTGKRARSVH